MFSNNSDKPKNPRPRLFNTTFNYNPAFDMLTITDNPIKEGRAVEPETLGAIHALMMYIKTMQDFDPERQEILARSFRFNHQPITGVDYESCEFEVVGLHSIYPLLFKIQQAGRDQAQEPYFSLWANLERSGVYKAFMDRHKDELGLGNSGQQHHSTKSDENPKKSGKRL